MTVGGSDYVCPKPGCGTGLSVVREPRASSIDRVSASEKDYYMCGSTNHVSQDWRPGDPYSKPDNLSRA
jgi:hypothetical protein